MHERTRRENEQNEYTGFSLLVCLCVPLTLGGIRCSGCMFWEYDWWREEQEVPSWPVYVRGRMCSVFVLTARYQSRRHSRPNLSHCLTIKKGLVEKSVHSQNNPYLVFFLPFCPLWDYTSAQDHTPLTLRGSYWNILWHTEDVQDFIIFIARVCKKWPLHRMTFIHAV